jgi:hypothetical protein
MELTKQLSDPENVAGFAEALAVLCFDKNERDKLGFRVREHITKKFTLNASAGKLCDLFVA